MRQTDVGIKCPDDARLPRSARAGVMKPRQIALTLLAGLGVALLGVPVVYLIFELPALQWIASAAAGYGAGTLINRAGGRNGGPVAIAVSVVAAAIPFLVYLAPYLLAGTVSLFGILPMIIAAVAAGLANRQS